MAQAGITIKVQTESLISAAGDVEAKIRRLEDAFSAMEQTVNASRSHWEGEGASSFQAAYRKRKDTIRTAFVRFRENVADLREIAGVYERSERTITETNRALESNWIED